MMLWALEYIAIGVLLAGFTGADEPVGWVLCLLLWPVILLYTLGVTIRSYIP